MAGGDDDNNIKNINTTITTTNNNVQYLFYLVNEIKEIKCNLPDGKAQMCLMNCAAGRKRDQDINDVILV